MASGVFKCVQCKGNLWPDTAHYKDHVHLEDPRTSLKAKYTRGFTGRRGGAPNRTNTKKAGKGDIRPRRRTYGPF